MSRKQITPVLDLIPEESRLTFAMQWVQLNGLQRKFLMAFVESGGSIKEAAISTGVTVHTHYLWTENQEYYRDVFEVYKVRAAQQLEDEAVRRAYVGVDEPVFFQGQDTGNRIRKFSDPLLIFLLKGLMPEKYRDRNTTEHTGPGGGPITIAALDVIVNGD